MILFLGIFEILFRSILEVVLYFVRYFLPRLVTYLTPFYNVLSTPPFENVQFL